MKRRTIRARSRNLSAAVCLAQQLEPRRLLASTVYVNDNWQITLDVGPPGQSPGDTVQSPSGETDVGTHTMDTDAFTTIADGIANVSSGGTVIVLEGNYAEVNNNINKPLTLEGVNPSLVTLTPSGADGHDDSAFNINAQQGLLVSSSNVSITGLTIDGGAGQDFRQGIITDFRNSTVYNNISVDDVVVTNIQRRGIEIYSSGGAGAPKSTGITIANSTIDNVGLYEGILIFDANANINHNTIRNCGIGLACNTLHGAANAPLLQVLSNNVYGDATRATIGMNLAGLADGSLISSYNVINQEGGPADPDTGLVVQFPYGQVTVSQNQFFDSGADSAIFLYAASDPAKPVIVQGNALTSTPIDQQFDGDGVGVFVTDDGQFFDASGSNPTYATISGNTISGFTRGIDLFRAGGTAGGSIVQATINNNNSSGGFNQIRVFDIDGPTNGYRAIANIINDSGSITGDNFGLDVDGGQATLTGVMNYARGTGVRVIDGGNLTIANTGFAFAGPVTNDATFNVNGSANVGPIDGTGNTTLGSSAFLLTDHVRQASLSENASATAIINNNGGPIGVSNLKALSLNATAKLDLTNNDMVIDYTGPTPVNTIRQYVKTGYNSGAWSGAQLTSSSAAGSSHHAAIGFAQSTDLFSSFPQTFSGQTIDNTSVVIKYTEVADANLDAVVSTIDFNLLAVNFSLSGKRWSQGDFDYSGTVDTIDFNLLANVFGAVFSRQPGPQPPPAGIPASIFSDEFVHNADRNDVPLAESLIA
jgi:hypothetical protein